MSIQDKQGQGTDVQTVSVQDEQGQGADLQTGKGLCTLMYNHISEVILSTCDPKNAVIIDAGDPSSWPIVRGMHVVRPPSSVIYNTGG